MLAYWHKLVSKVIIWVVDTVQIIPSLALLSILMIIFGLGNQTLIIGLVLYSLLPITEIHIQVFWGLSPLFVRLLKAWE